MAMTHKIALLPGGHPQHCVRYRPLDCRSANRRRIEISHDAFEATQRITWLRPN